MSEERKASSRGIAVLIWAICAGLGAAICLIMYSTSYDVREMLDWHSEFAVFGGIGIGTLIGIVAILVIKYAKKADPEASDEKQNGSMNPTILVTDEITQYKRLYDDGVITQEEFEAKKKQLLGLQ